MAGVRQGPGRGIPGHNRLRLVDAPVPDR